MTIPLDYFAATPEELAAIDPVTGPKGSGWPRVSCPGWVMEAEVHICAISDLDHWEFGNHHALFPVEQELTGPWMWRLRADFVNALAVITPSDIEEYGLAKRERQRLLDLTALARSARTDGRDLYSWSALPGRA